MGANAGPGAQASGIPPSASRLQSLPDLMGCGSRGRPFPVFRRGSSAAGLCGLGQSCDVGERKVSGQKFAGPEDSPLADPALSPSRVPATAPPGRHVWRAGYCAGESPSPGPPTNGIRSLGPCIPQPRGNAVQARERPAAGAEVTAAPGPRPVPQPRQRPARPRARAPLPARLGGGAHSSSSSTNSSGGDSSGAPGRSGLRAFQRVWTSMPAGHGSGRAGTLGVRARPGQRTQRGRHDLTKSWGAGAGPFSLWQRLSGTGLRVRSPTGRRARPWPAGRPGPRSARSLSPPPTPPTPACLPWPPPPRDPLPVGALLK